MAFHLFDVALWCSLCKPGLTAPIRWSLTVLLGPCERASFGVLLLVRGQQIMKIIKWGYEANARLISSPHRSLTVDNTLNNTAQNWLLEAEPKSFKSLLSPIYILENVSGSEWTGCFLSARFNFLNGQISEGGRFLRADDGWTPQRSAAEGDAQQGGAEAIRRWLGTKNNTREITDITSTEQLGA